VLFEANVAVVVNGDFVFGAEKTRRRKRGHRALGTHHETLSTTGKPARESA
jgi:hypothetical protein